MSHSTTDRKGPDGLTREERATLRDPHSYEVLDLTPYHFIACSREAFADFDVVIGFGRFVRVKSNTGGVHDLKIGEPCGCLDKLNRRADESCKHEAALEAVLVYRAGMGEREFLAAAPQPEERRAA
jgi:hypothetical protein